MNLLIRAATIIDRTSPFHQQKKDILIINGKIDSIKDKIKSEKSVKEIDATGKYVTIGFKDTFANFCDPGFEYKEDIISGAKAAAAGGYTSVAISPQTLPAKDSKSQIEYVRSKSEGNLVNVLPLGAISKECEGKEIAEIYDMQSAGAIAFTDGFHSIADSGLMLRALQYVKSFDGLVYSLPEDKTISPSGVMNESKESVKLGMKGIPNLAEAVMVQRDIELAEYSDSRVHFFCISTKDSVDLIRRAKSKGLKVTCGVNPLHLLLDDSMLGNFDSNLKLEPPLRTKEDIKALINGLKDDTIDVLCSSHNPQNEELKKVEFEYAAYGAIGLESAFAVANTALKSKLTLEKIIEKLNTNPAKILGLNVSSIKENEPADLCIFDPNIRWKFSLADISSKSKNSPVIGMSLTGKVSAVISNNQLFTN
jgi:dihydroorotase